MKTLRLSSPLKQLTLPHTENERIYNNYRILLADTVAEQLLTMGTKLIRESKADDRLLEESLALMGGKNYCTRCQAC